ncbi:hypothetical protein BH708_08705 [Brachybacterium sp. P6-10-X1]|uniref:AAA family ATPase n=1 Tax=Brachybacterium sp. P6-10-X1 TaxID=1903186 RepID=UPI0009717C47|nr:ATP-binding protein [Brachybacterium sp. P6-10-X1]APX32788.1 hypothetical protein BH708_08705 [Brachybacterium sp. P6-10-X1]
MTARLHLLYGLAGSGKSTLARRLAEEEPAVRFTLDEWMLRLYPDLTIEDPAYGDRAAEVRELIWTVAEQVLRADVDAVLDWNSWSVARRGWALARAAGAGVDVVLHRLSTSLEESTRRAQERENTGTAFAHTVDQAGNEHLASLREEPTPSERLTIIEH